MVMGPKAHEYFLWPSSPSGEYSSQLKLNSQQAAGREVRQQHHRLWRTRGQEGVPLLNTVLQSRGCLHGRLQAECPAAHVLGPWSQGGSVEGALHPLRCGETSWNATLRDITCISQEWVRSLGHGWPILEGVVIKQIWVPWLYLLLPLSTCNLLPACSHHRMSPSKR